MEREEEEKEEENFFKCSLFSLRPLRRAGESGVFDNCPREEEEAVITKGQTASLNVALKGRRSE